MSNDPFNPASFSLSDFKKWMTGQQKAAKPEKDVVGLRVEAKVSLRKLIDRMDCEDGDVDELAEEFKKDGGTISEVDGNKYLVEVENGSFIIHKVYVKIVD